jgi:hypothetical protein
MSPPALRRQRQNRPGITPACIAKRSALDFLRPHRHHSAKLLRTVIGAKPAISCWATVFLPPDPFGSATRLDSDRDLEALHLAPTATVEPFPFRAYLLQPP